MPTKAATRQCTFCGKNNSEVDSLVAGVGVYICDGCVATCNEILANKNSGPTSVMVASTMTDEEILDLLPKIATVVTQVEDGLMEWVHELRSRGVSWARIGATLGTTRQSAWERFSSEE